MFMHETDEDEYLPVKTNKAATMLLFELISRLQATATVPMTDVRAYSAYV